MQSSTRPVDERPFDALFLDIMDTVVVDPVYEVLPRLFGQSIEAIFSEMDPEVWPAFERGEIDEAAYFRRFFSDARAVDGAAIVKALCDGYRWVEGVEPLLMALKAQQVSVHALSNYPVWYRLIDEKLGLSRYLSMRRVSCLTGVRKPQPEAYLGAAAAVGVSPARCLFVDDRQSNCEAAEAAGMPSIRFTGAVDLRCALIDHGVLRSSGAHRGHAGG